MIYCVWPNFVGSLCRFVAKFCGKFVYVCGQILREVCFGSYFSSSIRREVCFGSYFSRREVCFGSYFSCVYCGRIWREVVLVPIFPETTSLHLAGSKYLVPIFPAFMLPYLAGSLFWFLFFQRLLWYYLAGILFRFLFFQLKCHIFLNSLCLDCILYVCQVLIHWVLVTLMAHVYLIVIVAAFSPRESKKDLVCLHLDYSRLII